ncbi:cryptochrome/photolyase family protein [Pseudoalteromonas aurantia]|uniref:Deoxyribodipyrimidine photolyase-related protein n=1 Tax=Pseudoalteromonas aurantia 208 TaxID=1314867 RepID=A0ABR9E7T8_9GAMM|nr:cryptochrome/photolyase family protein [Pseudoalteromonas aurantia]MBE0367059.1 deoxyribodipyrimidine photolyase-related protein [Pseudoalteromonas aurantia 208]
MQKARTLRLILGDQLDAGHHWFKTNDVNVTYVIAELHQEAHYTTHHIQKICGFFAAMRRFAMALKQANFNVVYLTLDDTSNDKSLPELIQRLCHEYQCDCFEYQRPDEYRLAIQLADMVLMHTRVHCIESEHFFLPFEEISTYFTKNKHITMEHFYRKMRKRFNILMNGDFPEGGKWNFDNENRKKLKKADLTDIPAPLLFDYDIRDIVQRIKKHKIATLGQLQHPFIWPTSRAEAHQLLHYFCRYLLPNFGKFQDTMTANSAHKWSLYHSRLSFALNTKILSPSEVIRSAVAAYKNHPSTISIAQIEGFVRQILGWREYIRAVYWVNMPDYRTYNTLNAKRDLPPQFWTGQTKMRCLQHAITQSLEYAYAHHIQRLMITGNFCLLTGIHPDQVDNWYLGIYIDAIEWVEMPNTRGMTQFADNGIVATKPYAASGNYVNKMSDYCGDCHYNVKEKTTETACPLNSLYWHFMITHRARFATNPRIGMVYRNWDKQDEITKQHTLTRAQYYLDNISSL